MFREIKKKHIILENRKPYPDQISEYIHELNMVDWIYGSMRMDGSILTRNQVERILKGAFIPDANLNEHAAIDRHRLLFKAAHDMLEMSFSLSPELIFNFAQKLTGDDNIGYRRTNPVLVSLNYNPPHPSDIEQQMKLLMNWFYADDTESNPILKAAELHHRIIEIYPFDSYSEAVARAAMYYFLMEQGYPPFELNLSEREYNIAIIEYLKKENSEPFYQAIEHSLLNKMEVLIQLTANEK
ncbi:MAG: Fic family protein [Clostridiales bacterium]|nr:Fic family protein [Clostridiales bacterium]